MIKPEDFKAKIDEVIGNLTDQSKVTTILADLHETIVKDVSEFNTAIETSKKLTDDNEKLRQANMNLFLKIGDVKQDDKKNPPVDNTPKFEDLFDDKGNLK